MEFFGDQNAPHLPLVLTSILQSAHRTCRCVAGSRLSSRYLERRAFHYHAKFWQSGVIRAQSRGLGRGAGCSRCYKLKLVSCLGHGVVDHRVLGRSLGGFGFVKGCIIAHRNLFDVVVAGDTSRLSESLGRECEECKKSCSE